jgi:hypothetical protein
MWIYTSTPSTGLHGVVLNSLSTGTTLPYLYNLFYKLILTLDILIMSS